MKVKITDVAKASGVSIATVSHVINHTRYVSPETTHKVEKAIQALSYSPDITARNFKKGRQGPCRHVGTGSVLQPFLADFKAAGGGDGPCQNAPDCI